MKRVPKSVMDGNHGSRPLGGSLEQHLVSKIVNTKFTLCLQLYKNNFKKFAYNNSEGNKCSLLTIIIRRLLNE